MGLYINAVECRHPTDTALRDQGMVDGLRPSIEAIVDRGAKATFGRTVPPAAAGLQHVDDPADHAASRRDAVAHWRKAMAKGLSAEDEASRAALEAAAADAAEDLDADARRSR
jgi:hypothetical protein